MSLLHLAAYRNHVGLVNSCLENGAVRHSCVEPYGTAFTAACLGEAMDTINVFLGDCNEDAELAYLVNRRAGCTGSALHYAAMAGKTETVRLLLLLGADVDARNDEGYTPLAMAIKGGHTDIVRVLCEEGASNPRTTTAHGLTSIDLAILAPKESDVLRALIDSTAVEVLDAANRTGFYPMHTAAAANKVHALDMLLQAGCSVHRSTPAGLTPAHYAAHGGAVDALLWLCNLGVDCWTSSADGSTPLHLAAERGHPQAVESLLLQQGASINAVSSSGYSALHLAAMNGHSAVLEALLTAQPPADPKLATPHGETPLLLARSRGHGQAEAQLRRLNGAEPSDQSLSAVSISAECHLDGRGKEYVQPLLFMTKLGIKHDTVYGL